MVDLVVAIHGTRVRFPLTAPMFSKKHQMMSAIIDTMIKDGKVDPKDFNGLIKEGLDPAVIECWYSKHLDQLFDK